MDEPRDAATFRMAVGGLGFGLVAALAGICLILAFGSGEGEANRALEVSGHGFHAKQRAGADRPGTRKKSTVHLSVDLGEPADGATVPNPLWAITAALAGALLGLLLPTPKLTWRPRTSLTPEVASPAGMVALTALLVLFLLALCGTLSDSAELKAPLAAGVGAAAIAVLIPSPARIDPE